MKKTILSVSFDETVSASRRAALEKAGYAVVATTRIPEALQMLRSVAFDGLVIGHRFSAPDKRKLAMEAAKLGVRAVLVCGASADTDIPADARVYGLEGMAGLLTALSRLLEERVAV